jgi:hypothetical protein
MKIPIRIKIKKVPKIPKFLKGTIAGCIPPVDNPAYHQLGPLVVSSGLT